MAKTETDWFSKVNSAINIMQVLRQNAVSASVRIEGAKIWLHIKTGHFTEKDRKRIHKIHRMVGTEFVKQYTRTNRVRYVANLNGITIYMNTNIPSSPTCELITKQKVTTQTRYSCPTK